jgi:hypothetical protein
LPAPTVLATCSNIFRRTMEGDTNL